MPGRLARRLLTIAVFTAAASTAAAATAAAQTGTIAGKVTNSATGQPVGGARVLVMAGGPTLDSTVTAEDGTYRLTRVAGTYAVAVRKVGFAPRPAENVVVVAGATATTNFALTDAAVQLNPVVTTASRGATHEKSLDAPVSIAVVSGEQMAAKPATMITDYVKTVPGVSVSTAGIAQANTVSRGFNNAFTTTMLGLQDYRYNALPSV